MHYEKSDMKTVNMLVEKNSLGKFEELENF